MPTYFTKIFSEIRLEMGKTEFLNRIFVIYVGGKENLMGNGNEILPSIMQTQTDKANLATMQAGASIRLQEYWQKRNIDLNYQMQKDMNQTVYQKELASIRVEETVQKAQMRANVSLEKSLKQLQITVLADGKLRLEQQRFGEPLQGILPFRIIFCKRYVPVFEDHPGILSMKFHEEGRGDKNFWLSLDEADPKTINKKFTILGLSFGFGGQKEMELRQKLVEQAIRISEYIELPYSHGWYCLNSELYYSFPEGLTWREVKSYAM